MAEDMRLKKSFAVFYAYELDRYCSRKNLRNEMPYHYRRMINSDYNFGNYSNFKRVGIRFGGYNYDYVNIINWIDLTLKTLHLDLEEIVEFNKNYKKKPLFSIDLDNAWARPLEVWADVRNDIPVVPRI